MSSVSLLIDNDSNFWKKISTSSISQSLNCLEKRGLQPPPSPTYSHTSTTHPSLSEAKENKLRKANSNVKSSHHKSFQNLTFFPFPIEMRDLLLILSHSFVDPSLTPLEHHPLSSSSNLSIMICFHKDSLFCSKSPIQLTKQCLVQDKNVANSETPTLLS